jgi:hypothetical protein
MQGRRGGAGEQHRGIGAVSATCTPAARGRVLRLICGSVNPGQRAAFGDPDAVLTPVPAILTPR